MRVSSSCFRCAILVAVLLAASLIPLLALEPKQGRKYALLVGVKQYSKNELTSLEFTERDVEELARVLIEGGYSEKNVVVMSQERAGKDADLLPTGAHIREQLKLLLQGRTEEDSLVVALAGHGVQFKDNEENYFCPADAKLSKLDSLLPLKEVYDELKKSKLGFKLLLVDACRNDPVPTGSRAGEKLESVTRPRKTPPPGGVAAFFSCSAGQKAYENKELKHGVFFHYVIKGLQGEANGGKRPEVTLSEVVAYVEREVPDFVRVEHKAGQVPELVGETRGSVALITLKKDGKVITNSIGMKLALIPAGTFSMGSPKNEEGRHENEEQHEVKITNPYYLGVHEVTVGQFRAFVRAEGYKTEAEKEDSENTWQNVGWEQTDDHPVVIVSWNDAVAFCDWLSKKEGKKYRLPTEAEWEYACRAGTTTPFHVGDGMSSTQANFNGDYPYGRASKGPFLGRSTKVGSYVANGFGLYDMHGNVWEWCSDWYDESYYKNSPRQDPENTKKDSGRVLRGGGWDNFGWACRSAFRIRFAPDFRHNVFGFRLAATSSR